MAPGLGRVGRPQERMEDAKGGVLLTLVSLFDQDGSGSVRKTDFAKCASALGYESSESSWMALARRFGTVEDDKSSLDISLVGDHFSNKYDDVLEHVLRVLLGGIVTLSTRVNGLEQTIDRFVNREENERNRKMRIIANRLRNRLLVLTFDAWSKAIKEQRDVMAKVAGHWTNRLTSSVWRRWVEMVQETRQQRQKVALVIGRVRNRTAAVAFGMWRELLEQVQARKAQALRRWVHGQLALIFDAWHESIEQDKRQRRLLNAMVARLRNRTVVLAFSTWKEMVEEAAYHREVLAMVTGRMLNRVISMAFAQWHEAVVEAVTARDEILRRVANRLANRTMVLAFETWKEQVDEKKSVMARTRQLAARMLNALAGQCFDGWVAFVEEKQRILRRASNAIGPGRLLFLTFQTWAHMWYEAAEQRGREQLEHSIDARMDEHWRSKVSAVQEMLEGVAAMKAQLEALPAELEEKMNRMREEQEERRKQERAHQVLRRWRNKAVAACFQAWAGELKAKKAHLARVSAKWRNADAARAWNCWMEMVRERERQEQLLRRVLHRLQNRLLARLYVGWWDLARKNGPSRRARRAAAVKRAKEDALLATLDQVGGRWIAAMAKRAGRTIAPEPDPSSAVVDGDSTPRDEADGAASPPTALQVLDRLFLPYSASDALSQSRIRELMDQQHKVLYHLMKLDEKNHFLNSILSNVVSDTSTLSALQRVARTTVPPVAPRPLREPPASSPLFSGDVDTQQVERILAGAAARSLRPSRSIPALGGPDKLY